MVTIRSGRKLPVLAALVVMLAAPLVFGGVKADICVEAPGVFCPGAPPAGEPNGAAFFDEVTPGLTLQTLPFVATMGDLVLCEGAAKADHSGCDTGVSISDILRFSPDVANPGQTDVTFLSDVDTSDTDKVDVDGNGADCRACK